MVSWANAMAFGENAVVFGANTGVFGENTVVLWAYAVVFVVAFLVVVFLVVVAVILYKLFFVDQGDLRYGRFLETRYTGKQRTVKDTFDALRFYRIL